MGRPAVPAAVHALRGNPSKLPADDLAAALDAEAAAATAAAGVMIAIPEPPRALGLAALAEWARLTPLLVQCGLVTNLDRMALAGYCQAYGEWEDLTARIEALNKSLPAAARKRGETALVDSTPSGYKQISALAQARDRALDRALRLGKEFGLTPASRISAPSGFGAKPAGQQPSLPGMPADPMDAFLEAGSPLAQAAVH